MDNSNGSDTGSLLALRFLGCRLLGKRYDAAMNDLMAYHITWTAYGSWLHGDSRGWVLSGLPCIMPADELLKRRTNERLTEEPVEFSLEQRRILEATILRHCEIRGWALHAQNARSNHVHVVVTANRDADEVLNQFKAWCSKRLSDALGLAYGQRGLKAGRRKWFTEHGSTPAIFDEEYFENAVRYVKFGQ